MSKQRLKMWCSNWYKEIWRIRRGWGQENFQNLMRSFSKFLLLESRGYPAGPGWASGSFIEMPSWPSTGWRSSISDGLCGRGAAKKLLLSQKDNSTKRLRYAVADKILTVMGWPPQSQDLNIPEEVWDHLEGRAIKDRINLQEISGSAEGSLGDCTRFTDQS